MLVALAFFPAGARADHRDNLRGLLYRVDAEAHALRLHPEGPGEEAAAVERQAARAADALDADGLVEAAAALRRESQSLMQAAQRREPQDVRAHAIAVEEMVRAVDDQLMGAP